MPSNHMSGAPVYQDLLEYLQARILGMYRCARIFGQIDSTMTEQEPVIGGNLRDADANTTSRYYLHVVGSEQRDAAETVARILCPDVAKSKRKSLHVD